MRYEHFGIAIYKSAGHFPVTWGKIDLINYKQQSKNEGRPGIKL
jgi:hypothetical protein